MQTANCNDFLEEGNRLECFKLMGGYFDELEATKRLLAHEAAETERVRLQEETKRDQSKEETERARTHEAAETERVRTHEDAVTKREKKSDQQFYRFGRKALFLTVGACILTSGATCLATAGVSSVTLAGRAVPKIIRALKGKQTESTDKNSTTTATPKKKD